MGWGTYDEVVAHGERGGLVGTEVVEVVRLAGKRCLDMVHNGLCDAGNVCNAHEERSATSRVARCRADAQDGGRTSIRTADARLPHLLITSRPFLLARLVDLRQVTYANSVSLRGVPQHTCAPVSVRTCLRLGAGFPMALGSITEVIVLDRG